MDTPTHEEIAAAFNEWMRRYTDEPERFLREWQVVQQFLAEDAKSGTPTYGNTCEAYLAELITEIRSAVT